MELIVGENSYITIEEADSIVENEYLSGDAEYKDWSMLDDGDKIKLIIKGTRKIDEQIFLGLKVNSWGLAWPRRLYNKTVECPIDVKIALLKNILTERKYSGTKEQELKDLGVTSYKVKDASITFATDGGSGNSKINGIYKDIYNTYLSKWLH